MRKQFLSAFFGNSFRLLDSHILSSYFFSSHPVGIEKQPKKETEIQETSNENIEFKLFWRRTIQMDEKNFGGWLPRQWNLIACLKFLKQKSQFHYELFSFRRHLSIIRLHSCLSHSPEESSWCHGLLRFHHKHHRLLQSSWWQRPAAESEWPATSSRWPRRPASSDGRAAGSRDAGCGSRLLQTTHSECPPLYSQLLDDLHQYVLLDLSTTGSGRS